MAELDPAWIEAELLPFLTPSARPDVLSVAMQYFLGLTGTEEGRRFIADGANCLQRIVALVNNEQAAIAKDACLAVVNLATDSSVGEILQGLPSFAQLVEWLLSFALYDGRVDSRVACMALSNLSRHETSATRIAAIMLTDHEPDLSIYRLVYVLCKEDSQGQLDYLGPFLSNLTQCHDVRSVILNRDRCVIQRLLPYITYSKSLTRRGGIVGAVRNCCFQTDYHEWLLSSDVDLLPRLLLPLAGPEEFDEDEMEKLPEDLQYLEPDKQREPDADIRRMLVETINQLCALHSCRQLIKDKNAYVILRELHKWEKEPANVVAIENLVSVLISDEPGPGMENLNQVEIPDDIDAKFRKADEKQDSGTG